jgi:hypothetical protein
MPKRMLAGKTRQVDVILQNHDVTNLHQETIIYVELDNNEAPLQVQRS